MVPVDSSNVSAIGYDADAQEIRVMFANGDTYGYTPASQELFDDFLSSGSKGQFMHRVLKRQCSARRV